MVEKFEAGKWYIDRQFGDVPFYVREVEDSRVTLESWDYFDKRTRIDVVDTSRVRREGSVVYFSQFREVPKEELQRLTSEYQGKIEFFKRK